MDEKRILAKIDELDIYLKEIKSIKISSFNEYISSIKNKRSIE